MRLEYLHYLLEIDRLHSITAAAQELYIGQATLSAIVRSVEQELGFPVFQRTHTGVTLTAEGEEALALAWEIRERFEEVEHLSGKVAADTWPVHIISSPTIFSALSVPLARAFAQENLHSSLIFQEVTGHEVGNKIIQNESNIGLTYYSPVQLSNFKTAASRYQIQIKPLITDRFYLLMRRDHPLASLDTVDISTLHGHSFAMLAYYKVMENLLWFVQALPMDNRRTVFSNISLLKRAVVECNMLSIVSGYASWYDGSVPGDSLRIMPVGVQGAENGMELCLIHQNNHSLRYAEKNAIRCIEEHFEEISAGAHFQRPDSPPQS